MVQLARVDRAHYPHYLGQALEYYSGDAFDVLQVVWPDQDGIFPDEEAWDDTFARFQPLLQQGG